MLGSVIPQPSPLYTLQIPWGSPQPIHSALPFFGVAHNQNSCTGSASSSQVWQDNFAFQPHTHIMRTLIDTNIVFVHCREEGCIGLYIPDDQEISQGKSRGRRDVQPNISRLEAVYGHSLIINPYQGKYISA